MLNQCKESPSPFHSMPWAERGKKAGKEEEKKDVPREKISKSKKEKKKSPNDPPRR